MEKEKTLEDLKTENELLSQHMQVISDKVKELAALLISGKEQNVKLTYAIRLFAETHLTKDEKMAIAQEFDRAVSAEQVEKIYNKYKEQVCPPGVDIEEDFMWSPGFSRDLEKYYLQHRGYNPLELIDSHAKVVRAQFKIEDDIRLADNPEKINALREAWQATREASAVAIDEILSVTNEILKK